MPYLERRAVSIRKEAPICLHSVVMVHMSALFVPQPHLFHIHYYYYAILKNPLWLALTERLFGKLKGCDYSHCWAVSSPLRRLVRKIHLTNNDEDHI